VDFLCVPNEARPLSHGIRAAFGVPLYTERNEATFGVLLDTEQNSAVKSWKNGRVWCSSMYWMKQGHKVMEERDIRSTPPSYRHSKTSASIRIPLKKHWKVQRASLASCIVVDLLMYALLLHSPQGLGWEVNYVGALEIIRTEVNWLKSWQISQLTLLQETMKMTKGFPSWKMLWTWFLMHYRNGIQVCFHIKCMCTFAVLEYWIPF